MSGIPARRLPVRRQQDAGRKGQHGEGIISGLVVVTDDDDPFVLDTKGVAILTEKEAFPQAFFDTRNIRWQVRQTGGQQHPLGEVASRATPRSKDPLFILAKRFNFILRQTYVKPFDLSLSKA